MKVFTVGHSTHPIDEFIGLISAHGVQTIADIRTIPKSRHNPQFGQHELEGSLKDAGLGYVRLESLGGLRHTTRASVNGVWRNASFRGYADYMQTREFAEGPKSVIYGTKVSGRVRGASTIMESVGRLHWNGTAEKFAGNWRSHDDWIGQR